MLAMLDEVAPTVYMERDGQKTGLLALGAALRAGAGCRAPQLTHSLMAAAGGVLCDLLLSGGHRRCRAPAEQPSQKAQQQQSWLLSAAVLAAFLVGLCVPVLLALLRQLRRRWSLPAAGVECQLPKVAPAAAAAASVELLSTPRVTFLPTPLRNEFQSSPSRRSPLARSSDEIPLPLPAEDEEEEEGRSPPPSPTFSEDSWHAAATSSHDGDGDSEEVARLLEAKQVRRSFPLSRSEKQLQLYQVLDQERQAAVQESRRLRGAASDAAQRLLAAAVGN